MRSLGTLRSALGGWLLVQGLFVLLSPAAAAEFARHGLSDASRLGLAGTEVAAAALFLVPRTSLLGGLLLLVVLGVALGLHVALGESTGALPLYVLLTLALVGLEARGVELRRVRS